MRRGLFALLLSGAAACAHSSSGPATTAPARPQSNEPAVKYGNESAVTLSSLERAGVESLLRSLPSCEVSPALVAAARSLAEGAANGVAGALAPTRLRAALGAAGAFDPAPRARLVAGSAADVAELISDGFRGATHVGVGVALRGDRIWLVALAARRTARLEPFPREVSVGTAAELRASLAGLRDPRVVVTGPSGSPADAGGGIGDSVRSRIRFEAAGRYVVEVVGKGPRGPEVAALLTVLAGGATDEAPREPREQVEAADAGTVETAVAQALNELRHAHGLEPVSADGALREVARRHSADMLDRGILGHALPGAGDLAYRLRRSEVAFRRAVENVARGCTALEAHEVAAESPAHRMNMLDPGVRRAGIAIARGTLPGGERVVYLTEILVEPAPESSPEDAASGVWNAIAAARSRGRLRPLTRDPSLDRLARSAARRMAREGSLRGSDLRAAALDLEGRRLSAADAVVSGSPETVARSAHALDPRFVKLGVGVALGVARRDPAGHLWIAVVYTD